MIIIFDIIKFEEVCWKLSVWLMVNVVGFCKEILCINCSEWVSDLKIGGLIMGVNEDLMK